ncbi:hypothetical protein FACS189413_16600 [Bacteroidia bacterium]|nr:hypothetical protein FACS189413_16600 [Bacteroidia bacterium]
MSRLTISGRCLGYAQHNDTRGKNKKDSRNLITHILLIIKKITTFAEIYFHKKMKQICIALFCISLVLPAQSQTNESNLQRELTLDKEYTPELRDADKLNQVPEVKTPEAPKTHAEYSNYTLDCNIPPYFQAMKAKNYFTDYKTSGKRGYLDLGIGTLFNFDGDAGYQILNSPENQLSVFASRRSSSSKVYYMQADENNTMKINDNLLGIDFWQKWKKLKLSADAQYAYFGFNDYGYTLSSTPPDKNRVNQRFLIHTGMESIHAERLTFKANLSYSQLRQKHPVENILSYGTENRIVADFDVFSEWLGIVGAVKSCQYQLPTSGTYFHDYADYATLSATPYVKFEGDVWDTQLGATFDWQVGEEKDFVVAPAIRFNWRPVDSFRIYLKATGGIKDNSNYINKLENRYSDPNYRTKDSKIPLDAVAGLSFSPLANLGVSFFIGNAWINDEHFFKDLPMRPQYDNVSLSKIGGSVRYDYQGFWDCSVDLQYNHWNMNRLSEAWHKPAFIGNAAFGINIPHLPLRFDLNYHLEAGRKAYDVAGSFSSLSGVYNETMKNINDISLSANYILNPTVSFFAKANNLLFQKYDIWYGYPAQNFNFMAGASIKF